MNMTVHEFIAEITKFPELFRKDMMNQQCPDLTLEEWLKVYHSWLSKSCKSSKPSKPFDYYSNIHIACST